MHLSADMARDVFYLPYLYTDWLLLALCTRHHFGMSYSRSQVMFLKCLMVLYRCFGIHACLEWLLCVCTLSVLCFHYGFYFYSIAKGGLTVRSKGCTRTWPLLCDRRKGGIDYVGGVVFDRLMSLPAFTHLGLSCCLHIRPTCIV